MKHLKKMSLKNIIIVIIVGIILSFGITTFAKYVIEEFHGYYLNAKHFYFTSNRLRKDHPVYFVNNWSGVGSFTISFDLSSKKNTYVYTDYDIPYQVTFNCPTGVTCNVDKPTGIIYASNVNHSDVVTLYVNPTLTYDEGDILTVTLSASSTSPYVEVIDATFKYVVGKKGVTYEIEDEANSPYMLFKVTNAVTYCEVVTAFGDYDVGDLIDNSVYRTLSAQNRAKCVSKTIGISFNPSILRIDTTNNLIDRSTYTSTTVSGIDYINTLEFNIEPVSTVAIKFYKVNPSLDYTYPFVNQNSVITVSVS